MKYIILSLFLSLRPLPLMRMIRIIHQTSPFEQGTKVDFENPY